MLEKDIVNKIMKYLKGLPNCWLFKMHGGLVRPDRALCKVD